MVEGANQSINQQLLYRDVLCKSYSTVHCKFTGPSSPVAVKLHITLLSITLTDMSKLQFKELSYFDVKGGDSGGEEEDEQEQDASNTSDRRSSGMSSYELFGLAAVTCTTTNGVSSVDHAAVADAGEDDSSRSLNHHEKKKRKKRKKRDSSAAAAAGVPLTSTAAADDDRSNASILDGNRSSFISKFLSKRRTSHPDITVPVIEASNARYLQLFIDHFTIGDAARRGGDAVDALQAERDSLSDEQASLDDGGSSSPEYDPTSFGRDLPSDEVDDLFLLTHDASAALSVSVSAPLEDTTDSCGGTVKLQLFNLPYKVSVKEVGRSAIMTAA